MLVWLLVMAVPVLTVVAVLSLACSLEPTRVFSREKYKRRLMAIFVTLHPKWNFMGQREDTSVA